MMSRLSIASTPPPVTNARPNAAASLLNRMAATSNAQSSQLISNLGVIGSMSVAADWIVSPSEGGLALHPINNDKICMHLTTRKNRVSSSSIIFLRELLGRKTGQQGSEVLLPSEIRKLQEVFGSRIGQNQFSAQVFLFQLTHAGISVLNGKTIIDVRGFYVDPYRKPRIEYQGVLINADGLGSIQEISLVGAPDRFYGQIKTFRKMLDSIQWRYPTNIMSSLDCLKSYDSSTYPPQVQIVANY